MARGMSSASLVIWKIQGLKHRMAVVISDFLSSLAMCLISLKQINTSKDETKRKGSLAKNTDLIGTNKNQSAAKYVAKSGLLGLMFSNTKGKGLPKRSLPVFAIDQPDKTMSLSS